jgi:hypothetical protein
MLGTHASFGGILMLRSVVSRETLSRGPLVIYPFDSLRMAVDQWSFLFACVRLGHRSMENQV